MTILADTPTAQTAPCSVEQADEIVRASEFFDLVDDYEFDEQVGHIYSLETGVSIVVDFQGVLHPPTEEDERMVDHVIATGRYPNEE